MSSVQTEVLVVRMAGRGEVFQTPQLAKTDSRRSKLSTLQTTLGILSAESQSRAVNCKVALMAITMIVKKFNYDDGSKYYIVETGDRLAPCIDANENV